jgi:hypothetical protein
MPITNLSQGEVSLSMPEWNSHFSLQGYFSGTIIAVPEYNPYRSMYQTTIVHPLFRPYQGFSLLAEARLSQCRKNIFLGITDLFKANFLYIEKELAKIRSPVLQYVVNQHTILTDHER